MALKLSMTETALILWVLRRRYEDLVVRAMPEDEEILEDMKKLIDTFSRSFKAKLRVGQ